ncbi:MAG: aminopeptidase [Clostridia bacterium]|nr:aminopeptidase [Clostridia bacterium]
METKNLWKSYTASELKKLEALCERYKEYLSTSKTERLCVKNAIREAEAAGFRDLEALIKAGKKLVAGDRFYAQYMGKTLILGIVGREALTAGTNILGAHIDSPRLDVKQNPLYENTEFAYLDTHYYGGIKKYQWVAVPLAIYGVVVKKDGTVVDVAIGDEEDDPIFCVSDLLIHLAKNQMSKTASVVIEGEALDLLIGSRPLPEKKAKGKAAKADEEKAKEAKEAVKANVLGLLKEKYGMEEEDFLSAELEIVPAGKARDLGLDRSMILGYGHDDRVCAYTSLAAILDCKTPSRTALCILSDKEEIGSVGATGMESRFFENTVAEVMELAGCYSELNLRRALARSCVLSSDVSAGFDPLYASAFETKNSAYLGHGVCFNKFTGAGGKGGSNDANAEYIGKLRGVMEAGKVGFQTAELGKVDEGGGGTIALILANYGMNVSDSGVAVLNMHAPWEAASKADIYEAYKAYGVFLEKMEM